MSEAEVLAITATTWRGQPAWRLAGVSRSVVVTATGAHLAALTARDDPLNALWEPSWPAADPAGVRPGPDCAYGDGPESALLAGICGSNLCLPRFGGPRPGEPGGVHGEAPVVPWTHAGGGVFTATLAGSALVVERRFLLSGEELNLVTQVRNAGPAPRQVGWCEHITLGGAFLDGVDVTAGIDRATTEPGVQDPGFRFPGSLVDVDPRAALAVPQAGDPACGDIITGRVADAWWQADNARLGWRLEARWDRDAFPWLAIWTQHRSRLGKPWNGRERSRGLEISTQPFPEGTPPPERAETFQGRPTSCRIAPGASLTKGIRLRWTRL